MSIVKFIPGKSHKWINYNINNLEMWIASDNGQYIANHISKNLNNLKAINQNKLNNILYSINKHFGLIVIGKNITFAAVDSCRSYPIYWANTKNGFILSNQAKVIAKVTNSKINKNQRIAFQMSGYTIGDSTLWSEIKNINFGEYIIFKKNRIYEKYRYFLYNPWIKSNLKLNDLKVQLKNEINIILKKLVETANGRTIAIPLSAGLDSRLIASGLKEIGYLNVKCFSYGLKNNFESKASKKIAKALGFKWKFVEFNNKIISNYFQSQHYRDCFDIINDGCAVPGIQDLYAIKKLLEDKFLLSNDLIVNGNSGDFISGGHIPHFAKKWDLQFNKNVLNLIFNAHYAKHYALWMHLLNKKNEKIIKRELNKQIKSITIKNNKEILPQGILELIEFENRQSKYVINFQRVYDFYKLSWALPLWDQSFINFWSSVPTEFKINQTLYKKVLYELNMGKVWTRDYEFKEKISPSWARYLRFILKIFFVLLGKNKWHKFDKKYLSYWTDNLCGQSLLPYNEIIKNKNGARHFVSWHTLYAEEITLGKNWQNLEIK